MTTPTLTPQQIEQAKKVIEKYRLCSIET